MNSRNSSLLCVALATLALSSAIEAFDITKMLSQYPELSTFSQYLTETKLADQINGRQTITVLAVDNSGISSLSGKPQATIKAILSNHVILDYYDEKKLMTAVESQKTQLTTLYQTTGSWLRHCTNGQIGFIKVDLIGEGEIAFGSAVNGAPMDVELVKTVVTQPYNISILQVVKPIIAPGIGGQSSPAPKSQAPSSSEPATKAPTASKKQVSPSSEPAPSSVISSSTVGAEGPLSDDAAPSDAPVPASSSSPRIQMGLTWAAIMGFSALLVSV